MFAEFMHHYNYTAEQTLNEYARRFFSLAGSMYKNEAKNNLVQLTNLSNGFNGGKQAEKLADNYKQQMEGNDRILREARNLKR
jgi:hypothetical protein